MIDTAQHRRRVVVVGLGPAGLAVTASLRRDGWSGHLTLLSAEHELPYDRQPLSKRYLAGDLDESRLRLTTPSQLDALSAEIGLGTRAVGPTTGMLPAR